MFRVKQETVTGKDRSPAAGPDDGLCIAVDLIPLLPGGENGGAKLLTMELVRHLGLIASNCEFVLLTSDRSHDELAVLDSRNVRRICVNRRLGAQESPPSTISRVKDRFHDKLRTVLPLRMRVMLDNAFRRTARRFSHGSLLKETGADLLFCPFTVPFCYDPSIPMVSVVYDLQYHYYPRFFTAEDRLSRERNFREACRLANKLICISQYVRRTVLENSDLGPDRVIGIPIRWPERLGKTPPRAISSLLASLGLAENGFLLYPANFWPHKNHLMLFTAFGIYLARHPESNLRLVCPGALEKERNALLEVLDGMGLGEKVILPGFIPDEEFAGLLASCLALIFPSLFEGFGMPVLEAMAAGKPVICSNVTSLPEVAGNAALYIDPRKPKEIAGAIEQIAEDGELRDRLVCLGRQRLESFGGPEEMARQYMDVFLEVARKPGPLSRMLHGVYPDGWIGERVVFTPGELSEPGSLELALHPPHWLTQESLSVLISDRNGHSETHVIGKGETTTIRFGLSKSAGTVQVLIEPVFQPKELGMGNDERVLSCLCQGCWLTSKTRREPLFEAA